MNQEKFLEKFQQKQSELQTTHLSPYYHWTKPLKDSSFEWLFSMIHPLKYPFDIGGKTNWLCDLQKNLQIRTAEIPYYSKKYIHSFISEIKRMWNEYFLESFEKELQWNGSPKFLNEAQWKTYRLSSLVKKEKSKQPLILSQEHIQLIIEQGSKLLETLIRYIFQQNRYQTKKEEHFSFLIDQLIPYILFFKQHIPKYWDSYRERMQYHAVIHFLSEHFKIHIEKQSYTKKTISVYRELNPSILLPQKKQFQFGGKISEHPFSFYYRYYDDVKKFLPRVLHKQFQEVLLYPFEVLKKSDHTTEKYQNILAYTEHFESLLKGDM